VSRPQHIPKHLARSHLQVVLVGGWQVEEDASYKSYVVQRQLVRIAGRVHDEKVLCVRGFMSDGQRAEAGGEGGLELAVLVVE
jgi:hypothetical protein